MTAASTPDLAADLALAIDAARAGGAEAMARFGGPLDVREKSPNNPVTDADLAVDAILAEHLRAARPDYGWLSEETADDDSRRNARRTWVVDPIDGTRAYMKGKPHFTVCVALLEEGRPLLGAVYNPATDEFFDAVAGGGARLNGAPIQASAVDAVEDCRMLGDKQMFAHPAWPVPWPPMRVEARNSIAYRLCLVAAGRHDGAIALSAKADWDLAAGALILAEAGGVASDHRGAPYRFDRPRPLQMSMVAAGKALHPLLVRRVSHVVLPG
jgi:myo-inositol-1(or 4)-monophosphatase